MGFVPSKALWLQRGARFFFYIQNIVQIHFSINILNAKNIPLLFLGLDAIIDLLTDI